jgi:hypothetical protein
MRLIQKKKFIGAIILLLAAVLGIIYWQINEKPSEQPKIQDEITILGETEVSPEKMIAYIQKKNPGVKLNCSIEELVRLYYEEGKTEGVRADLALCQAIKETGCFAYGKDVIPQQNNYCGLGTTGGGVQGAFFVTPKDGIRAHIQHLLAYATTRSPRKKLVDPRYVLIKDKHPEIFGKVNTWIGLNGKWAVPGKNYGQEILSMLEEAKRM